MSGESFEWAIKKDVRNNPIVREVDLERHRDMWRSMVIGVFLVAVLLFAAVQQVQLTRYGYEMGDTQKLLEQENVISRRLRLELEMYKSPAYIESEAARRLHMVQPPASDTIVIERVFETPAPAKSIVAQR